MRRQTPPQLNPDPDPASSHAGRVRLLLLATLVAVLGTASGGCATIRVTDPARTATEQFLISGSIQDAVAALSMDGLRDQLVFVDTTYLTGDPPPSNQGGVAAGQIIDRTRPSQDLLFLLGELRSRMLREGIRLTAQRDQATVVVEARTGGVGIDRYEFLLGIPSVAISGAATGGATGGVPLNSPELALLKSTRQLAFSSVAIVAYRPKGGELVSQSGPFTGRRLRADYWILGTGPNTVGDIPPAEK
ncbi:MAG: hypothetical protein JWO31_709 [Phycisphaerales bacterium]|nr:hypothetical protein [Phycisphaerales bacterium]